MSLTTNKEVLGDWSNLKGTRYHLVYALWLLLRRVAKEVMFYRGNDLLAKPTPPPDLDGQKDELITVQATETDTDIWIQLKATRSPWTVSALLEENLLFNFICNAAASESRCRRWRVELISEADVRQQEIHDFVAAKHAHANSRQKLTGIIDRARQHLEKENILLSQSKVSELADTVLLTLGGMEPLALDTLKAQVETVLALACPDGGAVQRIASTLIGALLLDAGAGPERACSYTAEWVNREAGVAVVSDRPFDTDVAGTCDRAVSEAVEASGPVSFRATHYVPRQRVRDALRQFRDTKECLFVLLGRSGIGKSWAVTDFVAESLRGGVRVLLAGSEIDPGASLSQLAADYFGRYSARGGRPTDVLARLLAVAGEAGRGPVLFVIDDLRVTTEAVSHYRTWIARLVREARQAGVKLVITCQEESWDLFRLHAQIEPLDLFNPQRGLTSSPITSSFTLDEFSPEELELALRQRLPDERASRALLHLNTPPFAPLRNPYLLERYLEQHGCHLGHSSTSPDPVDIDRLLATWVEDRLERVGMTLTVDIESVRAAFIAVADELWRRRSEDTTSAAAVGLLAAHLHELGQASLAAFRRAGLFTTGGAVRWTSGAVADHVYAHRLLARSQERASALTEPHLTQDETVVEAMVRMASNGAELAEQFLRQDARWRAAVARGLSQRPPEEIRTVALVQTLTRPPDDYFLDANGCEALGTLAARGRRGLHFRRAWRKAIEMYLSGDRAESLRGMHALAASFTYAPRRVRRIVQLRMRLELRQAGADTRRGIGRRMHDALGALHLITHRESALVARELLSTIDPLLWDSTPDDREDILDTIDYIRGRAAPFLGSMAIDELLRGLSATDRITRLRAAAAIRPAAYDAPNQLLPGVVAAIREETDPDVLLRLLWAAHPFVALSCRELLAAISASAAGRWDDPLSAGPALALLGEASAYEPDTVARMLPERLERLPGWARACLSDVHALAWWRCADRLPNLQRQLAQLAAPDLARSPRVFHVFLYRGCFLARLGLALLGRVSPFGFGISMTTHRDGRMPHCYSDVADFMTEHGPEIAATPDKTGIADILHSCIAADAFPARLIRYRTLENARFVCARDAVDNLCHIGWRMPDPLELLRDLPRDWQAIRAARFLLEHAVNHAEVVSFARTACEEHAQSGTANAFAERGRCLAQLARIDPDPREAIELLPNISPSSIKYRADEYAPRMSMLTDEHPEDVLGLLDQAIHTPDHVPLLFYWARHARSWRSILLSGVYSRMFSAEPIGRPSAIRLVTDVLSVVRSVPPCSLRTDYELIYGTIWSWLNGRRDVPDSVGLSAHSSPISHSHDLAISLLRRAADGEHSRNSFDWEQTLADSRYWWQCWQLAPGRDTLTVGCGSGIYLIHMLPALRLAAIAAGLRAGIPDPAASFMNSRYRVTSELSSIGRRYGAHEMTPVQQEDALSRALVLTGVCQRDERLDLYAGNLLVWLCRWREAEDRLQSCISHPLCSNDTRAAALYDLACVAARTGRPDNCREWLESAIRLEPRKIEQIATDRDLHSVHQAEWFKALVPGCAQDQSEKADSPKAQSALPAEPPQAQPRGGGPSDDTRMEAVLRYGSSLLSCFPPSADVALRDRKYRACIMLQLLERESNPHLTGPLLFGNAGEQAALQDIHSGCVMLANAWRMGNIQSGEPWNVPDPLSIPDPPLEVVNLLAAALNLLRTSRLVNYPG